MSNNIVLYRVMRQEEYEKLLYDGLSMPTENGYCPKKCLSESIVHTYRFNSFVQNAKPKIAKIVFSSGIVPFLETGVKSVNFRSFHRMDGFKSYEKYGDISFKYNAHGKDIDLNNYEIDETDIHYLNDAMIDVSEFMREDYSKELQSSLLLDGLSNREENFSLSRDEYYIQLPYDLALLALKYKQIPKGGLNKFVKARVLSKNLQLLDDVNYNAFPVTLAVKLNLPNLFRGKQKDLKNNETFSIEPIELIRLNSNIIDIRFVSYLKERNEYKYTSSLINKPVSMTDILDGHVLSESENSSSISLNEALNMLKENNEIFMKFKELTKTFDKEFFFADEYHDKNHAERVCFLSLVIANYLNVDSSLQNVLLMASLFHDIGKKIQNENHGEVAIKMLNDLNFNASSLIKFLIEAHDIDSSNTQKINDLLKKYKIVNQAEATNLLCILKDADALDRARFSAFVKSQQDLNPDYLNLNISLELIDLANYLIKVFYNNNLIKDKILVRKDE